MSWNPNIPLIAILRGITPDEILEHVDVLIKAGFSAVEIPTNSPNWEESISKTVNEFGDDIIIGGGTILSEEHVDSVINAGGKLIVTPNMNEKVIRKSVSNDMIITVGCITPTEIFIAIDNGAKIIKIFPSSNLGVSYIKSIMAVIPKDISIYAVGGITPDNLKDYLSVGCSGAGLGGDLYKAGQSVETTFNNANRFINSYKEYLK